MAEALSTPQVAPEETKAEADAIIGTTR